MKKKYNGLLCPVCKKPQFETRSGDVCINGHGGELGIDPPKKRKKKQIEGKDLKKIRKFFHKKQNHICPVLKMKYKTAEMVVDHVHSDNAKNLNRPEEAGLIRGVIHRQANTMEGKITNSFIRCGLHKFDITLQEFLRNLADFIEESTMTKLNYVHPSEKPKVKNLKKSSINKVVKAFKEKYPNKKLPAVLIYKQKKTKKGKLKDKEKKLTAGLERMFSEFKIEPDFKK